MSPDGFAVNPATRYPSANAVSNASRVALRHSTAFAGSSFMMRSRSDGTSMRFAGGFSPAARVSRRRAAISASSTGQATTMRSVLRPPASAFPVALPFLVFDNAVLAMRVSQGVAVVMLFGAGFVLGRHAGHRRPLVTGSAMALLGVVLIASVKALGG